MDHPTSLSQVQRANLNLLLLMRDAAMRDMGDAVCSFGLARQDFAAIMSRAPDELLSFVCGIGDQALFLPRSDLSSLLALPWDRPGHRLGALRHRAGNPSRRRLSASRR